uniref:Probable pectate lyase F n=1 Tax=Ditylenchus dipsaci TaxID=166011 RepID=A0A915DV49_9BILA
MKFENMRLKPLLERRLLHKHLSSCRGGNSGGSDSCVFKPFPKADNCEVAKETIKVAAGATFDGKGKCYTADKALGDGGVSEGQKPIIEVADGGTVNNVVFGKNAADGIHCLGSCKIIDTWWTDVGEDAATFNGKDGKVSVQGGGAKNAHDKVFQHNGGGSVDVNGIKVTNITADIVAINPNYGDTATLNDITVVGASKALICGKTEGNNKQMQPTKLGDGPDGKNCCSNEANSLDFEEFVNISILPNLAKLIYNAGLCGFAKFVQALTFQERQALTQVFSEPKSDWSFQTLKTFNRKVAQALGEGNNVMGVVPRTAQFEWHGWTFYNWADKMLQKYRTNVQHQGQLDATFPTCPCQLCVKGDNSVCVELSYKKAVMLQN